MKSIIEQTVNALKMGNIILYPTDTIWGIGCDATNHTAIEKIYAIKQRDHSKSMLILCSDEAMLRDYISELDNKTLSLALNSEKPTTVIFPHAKTLPQNLLAADGSIGIRIPHMEFCQEILKAFGKPIVSTSANLSGEPSPSCYSEISESLKERIDYCVPNDKKFPEEGKGSRIVKIDELGNLIVIRP